MSIYPLFQSFVETEFAQFLPAEDGMQKKQKACELELCVQVALKPLALHWERPV